MRNHIVIVGYGTKGRTAAAAMVGDEVAPADIVVVDENPAALERAKSAGLVTVRGSATDSEVLRLASAQHAKAIIVATNRDDSAVLVTLTARELAPKAKIIAAVREAENQHLLEQSGADSTVVTSETAGRLLGIAVQTPSVVEMMEDLLTPDAGFAIAEREVTPKEVGGSPRHLTDIVLGVVRNGKLLRVDDAGGRRRGDRRPVALHPQRGRRAMTSGDFRLRNVPLLSRVGADRADALRTDVDAALAGWPDALVLRVDRRNQVLISGGQVVLGQRRQARRQAAGERGLPRPARRRSARLGASAPRWRDPMIRTPRPRCSTCAAPVRSSTTSVPSWWRRLPRC